MSKCVNYVGIVLVGDVLCARANGRRADGRARLAGLGRPGRRARAPSILGLARLGNLIKYIRPQ